MAKYKKRADGRYYTSIPTGKLNEDGKEIRIHVYGHSLEEFGRNKDAAKAALLTGNYTNDKKLTFSNYKWKWYKIYIEDTTLSYARKQLYKNTLKNHTGQLDSLRLSMITKSDVQSGYNALNGHPNLQHEYYITVNQIFRTAIEDKLISDNPAYNLSTTKSQKKKKRALSLVERESIPKADFSLKERCFVEILRYAGLRREEILALSRSDIDLSREIISVNNVVEFIGERPNLRNYTKTPQGERVIDILLPLKPLLSEYLEDFTGHFLFENSQGELMSRTQYRRFFEKIKLKINDAANGRYHYEKIPNPKHPRYKLVYDLDMCEGLSAHTFRHEYATILYYSGVDLLEAIRLFGHSDSKTLTDIYAELRKEESKSKNKLNEYLSESYLNNSNLV